VSEPFGLRETLCWTGGRRLAGEGDVRFAGVSIDSRAVGAGELFVAIRGPRHDGHRFLEQAAARGAAGALVARDAELPAARPEIALVAVPDTTKALGALAAGHRGRFRGPVVAITGSNGKTTTKEMCAAILAVTGPCLKTEGNLNNAYGLPLTLLRREAWHRSAVVEIGMNHRGEIAPLARIARPDVGVVTNVGTAHIGNLGSRDEIAREKGDLIASLGADAMAVVNRDDPRVEAQATRAPGRVLRFGFDPAADVRATDVRFLDRGAFAFGLQAPWGAARVEVPGLAETAVQNALAAAAAALAAGAGLEHVAEGLAAYRNVDGRLTPRRLADGVTVIDDSYNANPQSVRAALECLSQVKGRGRGFAVLGEMGELGAEGAEAHRDAGRWAAELGVDFLIAVGASADAVAEGAREAGLAPDRVRAEADPPPETVARELAERLHSRDWVLVKGSRSMRMERIVEALGPAWEARRAGAREAG